MQKIIQIQTTDLKQSKTGDHYAVIEDKNGDRYTAFDDAWVDTIKRNDYTNKNVKITYHKSNGYRNFTALELTEDAPDNTVTKNTRIARHVALKAAVDYCDPSKTNHVLDVAQEFEDWLTREAEN